VTARVMAFLDHSMPIRLTDNSAQITAYRSQLTGHSADLAYRSQRTDHINQRSLQICLQVTAHRS
jgi:hypothetical protein